MSGFITTVTVKAIHWLQMSGGDDDDDDSPTESKRLPRNNKEYGKQEYWEERFGNEEEYEWLLSYAQLADHIQPRVKKNDRILIIGCGNSPFSADMYDDGYHNIVNIDFSVNVIQAMREKHEEKRPDMEWRVMDMTDMRDFTDGSFDIVIDKAAMDAVLVQERDPWNPDGGVILTTRAMLQHISRVLKPHGGCHIHISFAQPHFRKKYLLGWHGNESADTSQSDYSDEYKWSLSYFSAGKDSDTGSFGHYIYFMVRD